MHEKLSFGESDILIGTEPHQDINDGNAGFFLSRAPLPAHRRRSRSKTYKEN